MRIVKTRKFYIIHTAPTLLTIKSLIDSFNVSDEKFFENKCLFPLIFSGVDPKSRFYKFWQLFFQALVFFGEVGQLQKNFPPDQR